MNYIILTLGHCYSSTINLYLPTLSGCMYAVNPIPGIMMLASTVRPLMAIEFPDKAIPCKSLLAPSPMKCQDTRSPKHISIPSNVAYIRPLMAEIVKDYQSKKTKQCDFYASWNAKTNIMVSFCDSGR